MKRADVERIVDKRRKRVLANILDSFDATVAPYISEDQANAFRSLVRRQIHDYQQQVLDLLDDQVVLNQLYLDKLAEAEEAEEDQEAEAVHG